MSGFSNVRMVGNELKDIECGGADIDCGFEAFDGPDGPAYGPGHGAVAIGG